MTATVPGDVLSDLHQAGKIGDPLYELNFKDPAQQKIWMEDYTYTRSFALEGSGEGAVIVFDSIKMGARVSCDGTLLGTVTDQFVRYVFPLEGALVAGAAEHNVTVAFDASIDTEGRFMACSGGWDWAPYTLVSSSHNRGYMLSKGIVRSVYIAYLPTQPAPPAFITAVVTEVMYLGAYPAAPLTEDTKGDFEVRVRLHISSHAAWSGSVEVTGSWLEEAVSSLVSVQPGESNVTVVITAIKKDIKLWWPVGMGERPMFTVSSRLVSKAGAASESAVRRIGFRVFAIVTGNDTDPAWVAANTGADGTADPPLGMRFRVNGAAIFARGGNLVPLDVLEARNTAASHATLVRSVAEGGMNIMRIW